MGSQSAYTSSSYLPTKRSQLASKARIAKINELYEKSRPAHRDSVVSNNSTSVVPNNADSDNCAPIYGLKYKPQNAHPQGESTATVKQDNSALNPFRFGIRPQPSTPSPLFKGVPRNEKADLPSQIEKEEHMLNDHEESFEEELKFTPKLKSRRSLIISSNLSDDEASVKHDNPERLRRTSHSFRRRSRRLSLIRTLGDPLPLPYVNSRNDSEIGSTASATSNSTALSSESLNHKRRIIETKWRNLISPAKSVLEDRFGENKEHLDPTRSILGPVLPGLQSISSNNVQAFEPLKILEKEIITNREKLDEIITLLNKNSKIESPHINSNEYYFWVVCIIILIFCNVCVYYY